MNIFFLKNNTSKGAFFAMSSGLCFALLGYAGTSLMTTGFSLAIMLFWRFFGALLLLSLIAGKELRYIKQFKKEFMRIFFYGIFLYVPSSMSYFLACEEIGTGLGMVLFFSYPLFIVLINYFFYKKPILFSTGCALVTMIAGMMCIAPWQGVIFDQQGIVLSLFAACIYALYVLASANNSLPPLLATIGLCLGSATVSAVIAVCNNSFAFPSSLVAWCHLGILALVCTALPALFFLHSLRYLDPTRAAMFTVLEPIFALIFGALFLHEPLHLLQIFGAGMLLCGALVMLQTK